MSAVKNVIKDNYNMMLLKDYLREAIKDAGFSHAEISKTPTGTRVALHVTRPGIVIGRKGTGIRALTEKLETDFGLKSPQISVVEIEKPELSPSVMCNRMASHLERGTAFRRATMWTLKQIMEGGAMGVQTSNWAQRTAIPSWCPGWNLRSTWPNGSYLTIFPVAFEPARRLPSWQACDRRAARVRAP